MIVQPRLSIVIAAHRPHLKETTLGTITLQHQYTGLEHLKLKGDRRQVKRNQINSRCKVVLQHGSNGERCGVNGGLRDGRCKEQRDINIALLMGFSLGHRAKKIDRNYVSKRQQEVSQSLNREILIFVHRQLFIGL